jgi:LytS/YehU family sensor histidine kinase
VAFVVGILLNAVLAIYMFKEEPQFHDSMAFMWFIFVMSMSAALFLNTLYYTGYFYKHLLEESRQRAEHQLAALKNQINPHFLFNSLNSIASLIRINPEKAEEVTEDLAELFRYSLQAGKQHVTTLQNELESVQTYFRIEKARFSEKIELKTTIPQSLYMIHLPSLILQPLVENAVKHAAGKMTEKCTIVINAEEKPNGIWISVSDNGPGFPSIPRTELLAKGIGLTNVNERLQFAFGQRSALHFLKNTVSFLVPKSSDL